MFRSEKLSSMTFEIHYKREGINNHPVSSIEKLFYKNKLTSSLFAAKSMSEP